MEVLHGEGRREAGGLYVVATPIGNLEDISLRALKVLATVDVIAAEDTRNTSVLLARHGIPGRPVSLHEHNEARRAGQVVEWLQQGRSVALVSDAGTPGVSDPGAHVVACVRAAGLRVVPVPGPNAAVTAYSAAGLSGGRFLFYGFLPARAAARREAIASLAALPWALVFHEAPHRVVDSVADLAAGLPGERTLVIARELTKVYETVASLPLAEGESWLCADPNRCRGEFTLVVSGAVGSEAETSSWESTLAQLLQELPLAQSVRLTCTLTGARRKPVYERALALTAKDH